jgi:ribonuclease R
VLLLTEGKDRPSVRHKTSVDLSSDACIGAIDWPLLAPSGLTPYKDALEHGAAFFKSVMPPSACL